MTLIEKDGLKYFIYFISQNKQFPYIDTDIRKIIWKYANEPPYLLLRLMNDVTVKLNINI